MPAVVEWTMSPPINWPQRRSQVSLAGGGADRIPGGGGINPNTYSYGQRDNAIISPHYKLNLHVCSKGNIMCVTVFCKVLLIPNFNFLREKYGDTLMKNELHGCWAIFRRLPTSSAIPICLPMCKSFRIAVIFRKPLNLTQTKKCQGRQPRRGLKWPWQLSRRRPCGQLDTPLSKLATQDLVD